ncbi:uncharacterized protein RJT20DRAFT_154719 [Scheffersomyces xylosifermentans]|uniref:uncharacterized protein n=1 Tax=Scheffersomyces xylosifermentans TaxID=1304137 RepID=UPI00315D3DB6
MTYQDLPSRQKSQRLINRMKTQQQQQQFQQYKQRAKNIFNVNELLPGLNDISDAFEVLPMDLIKYFTLLKEIDAKCINTVPQINYLIKNYIGDLHEEKQKESEETESSKRELEFKRLSIIKEKINEIIPCLEEKMHVTSVATDLLNKHMFRINNDYKLIVNNNEIPESIRIGPLNHPAMIMDSNVSNGSAVDRSAQAARSESRREALAAKKASKEDVDEHLPVPKKKKNKEVTPSEPPKSTSGTGSATGTTKKRARKENDEVQRPVTPGSAASAPAAAPAKKKSKPKKEDDSSTSRANNASNANDNAINESNTIDRVKAEVPANKSTAAGEPTYCYCNQVSFGEMVGCDGDDCKREWFHLPCIGFKNPPKGKWYCDDCLVKMKKSKKVN